MTKIFIITVGILFIYMFVLIPIAGGLVVAGIIDPIIVEYMVESIWAGLFVVGVIVVGVELLNIIKEMWNDH